MPPFVRKETIRAGILYNEAGQIMSISAVEVQPLAVEVEFAEDALNVGLADGRIISVPLRWFPRLESASAADRKNWDLIGGGLGIRWAAIDEDISVESMLRLR